MPCLTFIQIFSSGIPARDEQEKARLTKLSVTERAQPVSRSGPEVVPSHSDLLGVYLPMTDPSDTRDSVPRLCSPLWTYLTGVVVAGIAALLVAEIRLGSGALAELTIAPLFWMLVVLVVLGTSAMSASMLATS